MQSTDAIELVVNGERHAVAGGDRPLLMVLRDEIGLTGAKPGCGEGSCGACTVLLDDEPAKACQVRLSEVAGRAVGTVEGLASDGRLHPVQQAFLAEGAFQCGYCTAGMVLATANLLARNPDPDDATIRDALADNVCRCGTYPRILRAVRHAAAGSGEGGESASAGAPSTMPPDARASDDWRPRRPWDRCSPAERDWFDVLQPGLVAVHEPPPPAFGWRTSAGAWLHIDGNGRVTAFTGKVDTGQGSRTSLAMVVADELRVPYERVWMVMGDTDLCPHDEGTFGSRSTPDAMPLLKAVAAGARGALVGLAAERLGLSAETLVARDGTVRDPGSGKTVEYGALVARERSVVTIVGNEAPLGGEGTAATPRRSGRITGRAIVTGTLRYPSDLALPGMRHGRVLRPPVLGALPRSVDTSAAAMLPGVTVVQDGPFVGVVAPSPALAGRALREIRVEWDRPELPSDADVADWLRRHELEAEGGWGGPFHRERGDVEAAFEVAPVYLSATYTTAYLAHVPLETRAALALWDDDGRLTVWTATQVPFGVREELADALDLRPDRVRVIVPDVGGGFGGKHEGTVALEAARLAQAAGVPVKVRWTRPEEFTEGLLRPAAVIDIRSGVRDGEITGWQMTNLNAGQFGLGGPYRVAAERLDYLPAESPLRQGSYRALAATANHFARESHMDELAVAAGEDAVEFRLSHLEDARLADVLRAAAERIGWDAKPRDPGHAYGIACGVEKGARVSTAVEVHVGADRRLSVDRVVTAFDCGAVIDPDGLENQIEGALVMGLGGALFEAVRFEDGAISNGTFTDYRVPRLPDVPPIDVLVLDRRDEDSTGAGETPIIAIAPAIANAIFAATGVRLRSMPLVPDGVVPG
jgi:isoquinoline 1-oxidoreductase